VRHSAFLIRFEMRINGAGYRKGPDDRSLYPAALPLKFTHSRRFAGC
jgi:hypothetical protein